MDKEGIGRRGGGGGGGAPARARVCDWAWIKNTIDLLKHLK